MKNILSIIISNKDDEGSLPQALEAIATQTVWPDEVILIDDGSQDGSKKIMTDFKAVHEGKCNIMLFLHEENKGVVTRVNEATHASKCKFVYFGASDDYILPTFVEKHKEILCRTKSRKVADKDYKNIKLCVSAAYGKSGFVKGAEVSTIPYIPGHCSCVDRKAIIEFGLHNPKIEWHCDHFLLHSIGYKYGFFAIDEDLSVKSPRPDSYGNRDSDSVKQLEVLYEMKRIVDEEKIYEDIREQMIARISSLPQGTTEAERRLQELVAQNNEAMRSLGNHTAEVESLKHQVNALSETLESIHDKNIKTKPLKILMTGHRGFLGRHLKKGLREKFPYCDVCVCDTETANLLEDKSLHVYNDIEFDYIFHLAAWTRAGDFCLHNQGDQWINNQKINTNMLSYWKNHQPQAKLIAFGTSCAYPPDMVKTEKNYITGPPDKDLFTYAMTKRMLLSGMQALAKQYNMNYIYFIPNTLYGPDFDEGDSHFIFDILKKICAAKHEGVVPVVLWGSGNQCREVVYVGDAVKMIVDSIDKINNEVINLGTGTEFRIKDYAESICSYVGYNYEEVQFDTSAFEGVKSKKLEPNELLGACDFTSFGDGMKETMHYYTNLKYDGQ